MNKPILSISILISNHYENVKRCLDSLRPLMVAVPSELILTDTGVDERVRGLLEQYTDHIIDYTWCQDFSAARNVGLREAKGQWFLYIDDDEWFEDTKAISDFLNSQEESSYNVAFYTQRNYLDFGGEQYIDHKVDRLLRINPQLHFEHRVHEAYTGITIGQKKVLDCFVHHYGYIYANEQEMLKKHNRNQQLLELECKEHPGDMRMQYQLILNQYETQDWDKAITYALSAIRQESDSEFWDACHTSILYCLEKKQDWSSLIQYGEEFLKKKIYPFDRFGILQFLITAYWNVGERKKVCDLGSEALDLYTQYKKDPSFFNRNQLMRTEFVEKESMTYMLIYMITAGLCLNCSNLIMELSTGVTAADVAEILAQPSIENWIASQVNSYQMNGGI